MTTSTKSLLAEVKEEAIEVKIRRIIAENFGLDQVTDEQLLSDLGDPLDLVEAIVAVEKEHNISIEDNDEFILSVDATVGHVVKALVKQIKAKK